MKSKIPFRNMGMRGWQNLAIVTVLALYALRVGYGYYVNGLASVPGDYLCFWSAGRLANEAGYAKIYDLAALFQMQRTIVPNATVVLPIFYLPIFILPFQILAFIPIVASFWLWTFLNVLILIVYIPFFIKRIPASLPRRTLLMILLAYPVFQNFYAGQVNLLLMVAMGEFLQALFHGRHARAGIWLAFLLLKPQTLILILPVLLIQRNWKIIVTFGSVSLVLLLFSFALIGVKGMGEISSSWLTGSLNNPTVAPENMMNWRMIAARTGELTAPVIGWVLAGIGMLGSLFYTFGLWRKPVSPDSSNAMFAWFGTLAATLLLSWHSHAHMAVILIPMLCHLYAGGLLPSRIINTWCFLPFLTLLAGAVLFSFISLLTPIKIPPSLADFLLSLGLLIQCFYFLVWSHGRIRNSSTPA